jgi:hypothetical protein
MMNDPLLPPTSPSERRIPPVSTKRTRRPGPAVSAKILATGLATTATLGLTAGYAFARNAQESQLTQTPQTNSDPVGNTTQTVPSVSAQSSTSPNNVSPNPSSPEVTTAPVVEITIPTLAPAQPGDNWNNSNNQPSSGSR